MGSNDDPSIKSGGLPELPQPDLNELREILLGDSWRKLLELEREILDHGSFSRRVAGVLPDSLRAANNTPATLVGAMQDPTIESISIAARKEKDRLSEALAPVIGPSIQRAIVEVLQKFTQSIETIAQHNFSLKGVKWRMEAARTGIPFHQVVLKHTLKYEVEQIYLIQKPSGMLVTHLMHPDLAEQSVDRDAIAGMMMAIQDFVRDSAFAETGERIQNIDLRGKTVWMCHGAWALLACVIEGQPPQSLRDDIKIVLDDIHGKYQHELREFNGDLAPLAQIELPMQPLLQRELVDDKAKGDKKSGLPGWLIVVGVGILAWLIYLMYSGYQSHAQRGRLESALKNTPGVVITDLDHVKGVWLARGMADPLAFDPKAIAAKANLDAANVKLDFLPYVSLDPDLVLRRARAALIPPPAVNLRLDGRVLIAKGVASEEWVARLKGMNATLLNVERIDFAQLKVDYSGPLTQIAQQLRALKIHFAEKLSLTADSQSQLAKAVDLIAWANKMAVSNGQPLQIVLIGRADATGSEEINAALKQDRAQTVKARMIELGIPAQILVIRQGQEPAPGKENNNRRVDIALEILP